VGERDRLDRLYKSLTRWVLGGTLPLMLLLLIVPGPVLQIFGSRFGGGTDALRILLIGQLVNVGVGSVGFILIMLGRTGWDQAVYVASFTLDRTIAFILAPRIGAEGAALAQTLTTVASNGARWLVWRFVHIQPLTSLYARLAIPAVAGGLVMALVAFATRRSPWPVQLAATAVAGTIAYVAVLALAGLNRTEIRALGRLLDGPTA
jgi:O-antigen/teichoic acid export membrane protein